MTRNQQIDALHEALGVLNALEYEAVGYDPAQLRAPIQNHPERARIERLMAARHAVHVVVTELERQQRE